jgi:tRNA-dihydrouridine synthase
MNDTMNIWDNLPKPFFALAPMEGVTDIVFRRVIARATRPDLFFTEFTNTSSFASEKGRHSTRDRLMFDESEQPIIAQVWGSKSEDFETTAYGLKEMGYCAIDINMGCPDKNVVRTGGGSDLIRNPKRAENIIKATKKAGLPVSVKTRLGYSEVEEWKDWITFLFRQDIINLTIHLRTKKEMSKVDAHYELIPEILQLRDEIAPQTMVCINGDIRNRREGLELASSYGIDGAMIGRGVFSDPFCFCETQMNHSIDDLISLLEYHLDEFDKFPGRKYDPLKRFFKIYIRDFAGASEMRDRLMHTKSTDEARDIIRSDYGR